MSKLIDFGGDAGSNLVGGLGTNSATFTMPGNVGMKVESVVATVNTASAAAATFATLTIRDSFGAVIAAQRQSTSIPAADTGTATFALRLFAEGASGTTPLGPIGAELDLVTNTSDVVVTGSFGAETTVISSNAVVYDGITTIRIEFDAAIVDTFNSGVFCTFDLYRGGTVIGLLGQVGGRTGGISAEAYRVVYQTPPAGAQTFHIKAYRTGVGLDPVITAGTGGSDWLPIFIRISVA